MQRDVNMASPESLGSTMGADEYPFIDTHAHYNLPCFSEDLDDTIAKVRASGVGKILCPAISYASNAEMLRALRAFPDVDFALGIHPKHVCPGSLARKETPDLATMRALCVWHEDRLKLMHRLAEQVESLRPMAESECRVVAIGEAGLDYSLHPSDFERQVQIALFRLQIELSLQLGLPLVLHVRDAHDDAIAVLRKYRGAARGVVHCFGGGQAEADDYLGLGLHLGIGGRVTHLSQGGLREAVSTLPADRILLETDAPYVLPKGFGSDRNDSTAIPLIAREVALLRGVDVMEVAEQTTANAKGLFWT